MWIRWCWVWLMGRNDLEGYQERNGLLEMWPSSRRHISLTFILYANAWPLWNHGKESNIQRNSQVEGEWGRKQGVKWQFYNGVRLHPFIEARGGGRWHQKESTFFTSSISEKLIPSSPTASILIIISRVLIKTTKEGAENLKQPKLECKQKNTKQKSRLWKASYSGLHLVTDFYKMQVTTEGKAQTLISEITCYSLLIVPVIFNQDHTILEKKAVQFFMFYVFANECSYLPSPLTS